MSRRTAFSAQALAVLAALAAAPRRLAPEGP
jgi:hypothetical protein